MNDFERETAFLLDECDQFLNDWERTFLNSIKDRDVDDLSQKQRDKFAQIRDKCSERYAEMEGNDGSEKRWDR